MNNERLLKALDEQISLRMQEHMEDPLRQLRILEQALRNIGMDSVALRLEFLASDLRKTHETCAGQ